MTAGDLAPSAPAGAPSHAIAAPPYATPAFLTPHAFEKTFTVSAPREAVWAWLEDPDTFVKGQVWPFRVEFVSADPGVPPGFHVGGLNIHHGPLMSFTGILTEIREGEYRDLQYLYGSYVGSLRWIRPTRLEFWVEDAEAGGTRVRLRVGSDVRPGLASLWTRAQELFWARFPRWMARSLRCRVTG